MASRAEEAKVIPQKSIIFTRRLGIDFSFHKGRERFGHHRRQECQQRRSEGDVGSASPTINPALIFLPNASSGSRRRPIGRTAPLSAANRSAIVAPMPVPPPVIKAVFL